MKILPAHANIKSVTKITLVLIALTASGASWAGDNKTAKLLPDLFGTQRALPADALQVADVTADIKNFKGTIVVRGVMAAASAKDPSLFLMIDSREARACSDLHCAKKYLPVKVSSALPKPWDELNVRGVIVDDPKSDTQFVQAESVENLGSIKSSSR